MTLVEMPKANENLTEATLEHWLAAEGQDVLKDQPLCEIITDKASFELPSPAAGKLLKVYGPERSMLPVGYVLCAIGAVHEAAPVGVEERNRALVQAHRGTVTAAGGGAGAAGGVSGGGVRATPAARRVARENGVGLAEVAEALKINRPVNEKDVRKYIEERGGSAR